MPEERATRRRTAEVDRCADCGVEVGNGRGRCRDCARVCDHCGDDFGCGGGSWCGEQWLCWSCEDARVCCYSCGDVIHDGEGHEVGGSVFCDGCECTWTECSMCGGVPVNTETRRRVDGGPVCGMCNRRARSGPGAVHDWNYRPPLRFFSRARPTGEGERDLFRRLHRHEHPARGARMPLFLGVELETEYRGGDSERMRSCVSKVVGDEWLMHAKRDGSLTNGVEFVTQPFTLGYGLGHAQVFGPLMALKRKRFRSHNGGACGLHVHMSRWGFGDLQLYKFLRLFLERNSWEWIRSFSRRGENAMGYCQLSYDEGYGGGPSLAKVAKDKSHPSRYVAVNVSNGRTVEVRVFRGTLNPRTFWASLEFCQAAYTWARSVPVPKANVDGFLEWLRVGVPGQFRDLEGYISKRNLWI